MNPTEYTWVKQTRAILLDFCSQLSLEEYTHEPESGSQRIRNTLVHIADCYHAWLGSYILLQTMKPITSKEDLEAFDWTAVTARFAQVDSYVDEIFQQYAHRMDEPIERTIPWREGSEPISMMPRKLLMHTVTHEFHHKGQIMAMARQMGYEPPNTDVLGVPD